MNPLYLKFGRTANFPIQDNSLDQSERHVLLGHNKAGDFYLTDTLFNGEEGILPLDADSQRYQPKRKL